MQPTILRKYWKTAAMAAAGYVGDSPLFLMDYLLRFLRVAVLLSIWRTILTNKGAVSGMTMESVLTYTLIAEVFREQLECRTELQAAFWEGSLATRFLQPLGIFGQFAAEMFGRWSFSFCAFSLPLLACSPLLGVNPLPVDAGSAGLFVLSLTLAISVGLAMEYIFVAMMVALDLNVYAIDRIRAAVSLLLSGAILPLALFPWGIGRIFTWLPFASMASAPLRIYTGAGDIWRLIALQMAWSLILWPVAHRLWRANRERLVFYGG